MSEPIVRAEGVTKTYRTGDIEVPALRGVSFEAPAGELITIRGRSGSGKTTLLNVLGGLEPPDSGTVHVAGREVTALNEQGLLKLRRESLSYVFQTHGLIPVLSAAENIEVPLRLAKMKPSERDARVKTMLGLVGLADHAEQRPHELSGGQRQRVAIARALANRPRLILADEPTGQLDSETAGKIMPLLRALVRSEGVTVVVTTHDPVMLGLSDRVFALTDGRITEEPVPVT